MRHKRLWAAVLALMLVFSLSACGGENATTAPTETDTAEPTPTPEPASLTGKYLKG